MSNNKYDTVISVLNEFIHFTFKCSCRDAKNSTTTQNTCTPLKSFLRSLVPRNPIDINIDIDIDIINT